MVRSKSRRLHPLYAIGMIVSSELKTKLWKLRVTYKLRRKLRRRSLRAKLNLRIQWLFAFSRVQSRKHLLKRLPQLASEEVIAEIAMTEVIELYGEPALKRMNSHTSQMEAA